MSHQTCFTVRVEAWGRFQWTAHVNDTRLSPMYMTTSRKTTPQECLRDIANQIDEQCVNEIFMPLTTPKENP